METASVHPITKAANKASGLSLIIIALVFIATLYMMFWPIEIITIDSPIPVITKVVPAGGLLEYCVTYNKKINVPAMGHRSLVNDTFINLPSKRTNAPVGERKVLLTAPVPTYAAAGKYRLKTDLDYKVNPLRTIRVTVWTEEFEVTNDVLEIQQDIAEDGRPHE